MLSAFGIEASRTKGRVATTMYEKWHLTGNASLRKPSFPFQTGPPIVPYSGRWHYEQRILHVMGITCLYGVPTSYPAIAKILVVDADISSIRPRVAVGFAPLPAELAITLENMNGVQPANLNGLTEAAAISMVPPDGETRHSACGIQYPYVVIKMGLIWPTSPRIRTIKR